MEVTNILKYDEQDISSDIYIAKLPCEALPSDEKKKVLDYLLNANFRKFTCMEDPFSDPWTGHLMWNYGSTYSDEYYFWDDKLPFYVRDHDLRLPETFIEHVLDFYENGGHTTPSFDWETERIGERKIHNLPKGKFTRPTVRFDEAHR